MRGVEQRVSLESKLIIGRLAMEMDIREAIASKEHLKASWKRRHRNAAGLKLMSLGFGELVGVWPTYYTYVCESVAC